MVLVMESDGSLTPSRSQSSFARNYNDGIGQGSASDGIAIFGETLYPAPDSRPADTKLPNGVIDATFQTASSFEVCLNKRTENGHPARLLSTSGNGVFAIIIHQYLPHEAANPVSGLRGHPQFVCHSLNKLRRLMGCSRGIEEALGTHQQRAGG